MKIIGLRPYCLKTKDTGEEIKGVTVFCSFTDKNVQGTAVEKFSITDSKLGQIPLDLGMEVEPLYSKYGKVAGIKKLA